MKYFGIGRETSFPKDEMIDLLLSIGETDEDPLDYILEECRSSTKVFLEEVMRTECDLHLGFEPYKRGIGKQDSRNGYYERDLETVFGLLEDLRIPRTRSNTFQTKLFAKYQRRQKQVAKLIREMFVHGISTRRIAEVLIPPGFQDDTVVYSRHGGWSWREKLASVPTKYGEPNNCGIRLPLLPNIAERCPSFCAELLASTLIRWRKCSGRAVERSFVIETLFAIKTMLPRSNGVVADTAPCRLTRKTSSLPSGRTRRLPEEF